ncbi:MAG: hypothetical protein DI562_19000 [Stenotrophomonas acidaminiphila]|nr:MAG: hypothetical protein DI562_19000 [Stenotrophomonas acidaminiphila]
MAVRDALLVAGDQIVFDAQHRFVLEVPWAPSAKLEDAAAIDDAASASAEPAAPAKPASSALRWPWLLLAALLMAGALSALLLFGAG